MTLGGVTWVRNGWYYDYCFRESIQCLKELCDEVIIIDAGSDDLTDRTVKQFEDQKTMVVCLGQDEWEKQKGKEKLAYFQNLALSFLSTDYYFLLQADEIIHEDSFPFIRQAIETREEGIVCSRINLWRDCNSYINVPESRQPCSTKVIRLAKTNHQSVDDGESIKAYSISKFVEDIRIYHYGFVRKVDIMKRKVINMQEGVFGVAHDPKLDKSEVFDWSLWFNESELSPIKEEHPKFIKEWIKTRP